MSTATGLFAADFASRMTTVACVVARCAVWRGFARNVTAPACAADSGAMLSTRTSGSPRSSQPNRTASSPSERDMWERAAGAGARERRGWRYFGAAGFGIGALPAGAAGFGIGSSLYKPGKQAAAVREDADRFVAAWKGLVRA